MRFVKIENTFAKNIKPFRYMGGQSLLMPFILKVIPEHEYYVEVFGGSATLLFNKRLSNKEVYNDIDNNIVNLLLQIRDNSDKLYEKMRYMPFSRKIFEEQLSIIPKNKIDFAIKTFYLLWASRESQMKDFNPSDITKKPHEVVYAEVLKKLNRFSDRLLPVIIENKDFEDIFKKYDRDTTLFFCDPPYYGKFLYTHSFTLKDHVRLKNCLDNLKGRFLLTYNYAKIIRKIYKNYYQVLVSNLKGAGHESGQRKFQYHLVIANYDIENMDFVPFSESHKEIV